MKLTPQLRPPWTRPTSDRLALEGLGKLLGHDNLGFSLANDGKTMTIKIIIITALKTLTVLARALALTAGIQSWGGKQRFVTFKG